MCDSSFKRVLIIELWAIRIGYVNSPLLVALKCLLEAGRFWCKKSIKLGHTDITTLEKVCDQYEKGKFIQMEALSA
ncbi:hypothetical protein EXW51_30375 (plasmid) [Bacillus mycoides]|nr:hypothetical protein EXW51_30375 [Bacillus mycoides]